MNRNLIALLVLIALFAAFSTWLNINLEPTLATDGKEERRPDYYADTLKIVSYDSQGRISYRLETPSMLHFGEGVMELAEPRLWQYTPDSSPLIIQGKKAQLNEDQNKLFLPGEVKIKRDAKGATQNLFITTRDLHYDIAGSYAETDQPIRVESGADWLTAIGVQAWFGESARIKLLHQVEGQYARL